VDIGSGPASVTKRAGDGGGKRSWHGDLRGRVCHADNPVNPTATSEQLLYISLATKEAVSTYGKTHDVFRHDLPTLQNSSATSLLRMRS
jgi:hypothetical protein